MIKTALYPGTFDPLTHGHLDIVQRASQLFETLIVAVATSARKAPYLSLEVRLDLVKAVTKPIKNVQVVPCLGLLVDLARTHHVGCIVRGIRGVNDVEGEWQLAGMNRTLMPSLETLFLPARGELAGLSGTMVREIVALGGDVSAFVPPEVAAYLMRRVH
jgi:pantetheine-phosphate adenylyltransferase